MDILFFLQVALRALARNKLRSGLTMLGIVIGVGALIVIIGIGQGARIAVENTIASFGSPNMLYVVSGNVSKGGVHLGTGQANTLVSADVTAILRDCPAVHLTAPGNSVSSQVIYGNNNWSTTIWGTSPVYFEIRNWSIQEGQPFSEEDVERGANVAVIGDTIRKNLFSGINPIGQVIRINHIPFKVVGLLEAKGQLPFNGEDQDDVVFVPITTLARKLAGEDWLHYIAVTAISRQATSAAQQQITVLLRDRHHIPSGQEDDFRVNNLEEVANLADRASLVMTLLLGSVASLSLIVGGVGIMNIMLVSVTERTREIGIRMAVGATDVDIRRQFIIEAVLLSMFGAVSGIMIAVSSLLLISKIFEWRIPISPISIVIAVIFSTAIGIFFGFYPAKKAANLDPIEALRFE